MVTADMLGIKRQHWQNWPFGLQSILGWYNLSFTMLWAIRLLLFLDSFDKSTFATIAHHEINARQRRNRSGV